MLELAFKNFYEKKTLLILHGLFGSSDNWQNLAKKFSNDFLVFVLDLRNHGNSPHSNIMTYQHMADDILYFMNRHQLNKISIIGHSLGGKVAMKLASDHPERVEKAIFVDIAPKTYKKSHDGIIDAMKGINFALLHTRREIDHELETMIPNKNIRQFLLKNLIRTEKGFKWQLNIDGIQKNYSALLASPELSKPFLNPVLFIKGEKSNYITNVDKNRMQDYFPNYTLEEIPLTGHWLHAEDPKIFYEFSLAFLK